MRCKRVDIRNFSWGEARKWWKEGSKVGQRGRVQEIEQLYAL